MKSNFNFFIGLFGALLVSWLGIVLGSNAQLGSLPPYDDGDGTTHPEWMPGVAAQGQLVYRDLGCAACHTQQVRRPSFGSDQARGWGDRQSVARDYIYQPAPQLGLQRVGPDLTNVGDRKPSAMDADDLMGLLYAGIDGMPSYKFLFETRKIGSGAQPSDRALKLTGALKPKDGWEIVPTSRAESLVGYLVNLKTTYTYPEATPLAPAKPENEPAAAAPAAGAAATGASGSTGTSGATGATAVSGASGASGAAAATGASGSTGAIGTTGASGTSGAAGAAAASGATGASAATGTTGSSGTTGATGTTGSSGASGTSGSTGAAAASGTSGATGATGTPSPAPAPSGGSGAASGASAAPAASGGATPAPAAAPAAAPAPATSPASGAPATTGGTK